MISAQANIECLGRLSALRYFPTKDAAVSAIGKILNDTCSTDAEARILVGFILERCEEWPGPGRIRQIYRDEIASRRPPEPEPAGCRDCEGTGLQRVFQLTTEDDLGNRCEKRIPVEGGWKNEQKTQKDLQQRYPGVYIYGLVKPCTCPLGEQFREQWRRYDEGKKH